MAEVKLNQVERFFDEQEKANVTVVTLDDKGLIHMANGLYLEFRRLANLQQGVALEYLYDVLNLYKQFVPLIESILSEAHQKGIEQDLRDSKIDSFEKYSGKDSTKN